MKENISILGSGWLGKPLAKRLVSEGYNVKVSTTSPDKLDQLKGLHLKSFLISTDNLSNKDVLFFTSDILIICVPPRRLDITPDFLDLVTSSTIKKVLFVSSTSVYDTIEGIVTENSPIKSNKLTNQETAFTSNTKLATTILRFGGLFNEQRNPGNFFTSKPIQNPNAPVNMIHQNDCIQLIYELIEKQVWNNVFNACADTHPKKKDFYTKAALAIGKPKPEYDDTNLNSGKIVATEKIKDALNYTYQYADLMKINS